MAKKMFDVHVPQLVKVAMLNPSVYNPRKISPEKFEGLKQSILTEGFVEPIVVQKSRMAIIGGHQRVRAVKEISIEAGVAPPDIPCVVLDIDDVRAKKLNIKLNAIKGDFEARMLGELILDIYEEHKIEPEEAMHLGFSEDEVMKYIHIVEPDLAVEEQSDEPKSFGKSITLSLEFSTVAERDRIKKLLADRSKLEKKKTGDIVTSLLMMRRKSKKTSNGKRAHT